MVDGFGLAGLPDVSDDDWNAYTADQFSASIDPFRESLRFQQMTANAFDPILNAAAAAEPPPTMGAPVGQGLRPAQPVPDSGYGGYTQPDFGSLRSMMDAPDSHQVQIGPTAGPGLNQPGGPIHPPAMPGPLGALQPGYWYGTDTDPSKPGLFSYLGEKAQQGADALRSGGFSQTPVVGPIAAGGAQFAANALNNLGGTAEAMRQGNPLGAAGGLLQATVGENTPLGIGKDIATEAQWPTQIVPGISPETPVIGGLNNPRELAGLIPQMALPETALERTVGHGIREAAGPVLRGAGELAGRAADRLGIAAAPDGRLGLGVTVGEGGSEAFHGSATPYERVDASKFNPDGLYGPGYYKTTSPEVAESYAGELRGGVGQHSGTVADWSQDLNRAIDSAAARGIPGAAPSSTFRPDTYLGSALQRIKEDFAPNGFYGRTSAYMDDWRRGAADTLRDAFGADIESVDEALSAGQIGQAEAERIWRELDDSRSHFYDALDAIERKYTNVAQANIRKVNVPEGAQYLDVNKALPQNEWQQIQNELRRKVDVGDLHPDDLAEFGARVSDSQRRRFINASPDWRTQPNFNDLLGEDYYQALRRTFADKSGANKFLSDAGFDGVTHEGGRIMPLRNAAGEAIRHQVYVTFPDQIGKLTNALSGVPGGIAQGAGQGAMSALESPFFSPARTGGQAAADIALGAAGGAAGAATGPEDQTWQERAKRGVAGAALGAMSGPLARAPRGGLALARRAMEGRGDELPLRAAAGGEDIPPGVPPVVPPHLTPDTDPLPPVERAGDVLGRVLAEMTPEGRAQAQEMGALGEHRAPWLGQAVEATAGEAPTGGNRYTDIMAVADPEKTLDATGSPGDSVGDAMDAATTPGADTPYEPPHKFDKAELARLGGTRILQNLPDAQREMAEQGVADMTEQLQRDHGFRSEASAKEAAQRIMPHILQFARNAKPNEPVNEVLLRAARDAWAQSIFPSYFAQIEHWKMRNDPAASDADKGAYAQAESYWDAVRQVLGRYAGEIAPSEAARTFRAMRDLPEPVVASVAGGSGVAGPINRAAKTPREKAYEDMMAAMRKSRRGETAAETAGETASRRGTARVSGKRPSGPLANLGLEWADVLRRTGNDDADRMNILAGLEELGGYRMRRDWVDRAMKLDLSDGKSVDAFWDAARKSAGVDEQMRPFVKFDPNVSGQSYLGGADALTKNQALSMVSKELIRDADQAQSAARAARDAGKPSKSLDEAAAAAFERLGLKIDNWNPDNLPILSRAAESVRERIAREWPADRKAGSGAAEQVEKKRQLLGIFDQEIKKGQRLAGVPVTGIQDLLSFGTSNVLTTARFVQASVLESALSAINEPLQSFLRGRYGEGVQQLRGLGRAFGFTPSGDDLLALGEGVRAPAMANALRGLKDIGPMESAGELRQVAEKGAGMIRSDTPNAFAKMMSPMHRVSRGISEAFQTGNYFAEVNRLAHEASTTGRLPGGRRIEQIVDDATGETRNPTVKELFGNLPQDIVDEALKRSRLTNAGGEVGRIEGWVGQAKGMLNKPNATSMERTTGLFANLMLPFVYGLRPAIRAGEAGIKGPIEYPINVVQALARGDTEEAKYAGKKAALAIGFDGFIAYNVLGGNITGHGPSSPEARQALMEQTDERGDPIWRPDSYRIATPGGGHAWIKYSSLPGPVSTVATVMANLYEAYVYDGKDMETAPEQAQRMAMSVLPSYLDNTYFRDMINLVEAMGANGGAPQVGRVAEQVLGRFVPGAGALRTAATVTDPYARLAEYPGQGIASGIPGLRQRLPARVSAYTGGPVEEPISAASLAGGLAGNVYGSPSRPNPLAREAATLSARDPFTGVRPSEGVPGGVFPNSFGRGEQSRGTDFAGQRQTPEAIRGAQAAFGQQSQADLLPLINSAEYAAMDPHAKAQRLAQEVRRSTAGSEYAAEGAPGIALDPNRQVQREMLQVPRYYGVSGSPDQIAEQNQQIAAARNSLSQLITRYGRGRAMGMLAEQNPEAFRLAMIHKPMNRDALWFQEQQFSQRAGVGLDTAGVYVPDYGSGSDVITGNGAFDRRALPPGLRS